MQFSRFLKLGLTLAGVLLPGVHGRILLPVGKCHTAADRSLPAFSTELRVEVEPPAHQLPREGSSSEYSSSSSSPMGVQAREESSDSAEESDRRKIPVLWPGPAPPTELAVTLLTVFPVLRCGQPC